MTAIADVVTDHSQGALEQTNLPLDFAIEGEGYFSVQTNDGVAYTRNGSFMLDNEGYLHLGGQGRVLGANGQPIYLGTDKINADSNGFITNEQGAVLGQLGVFTFANPAQDLQKGQWVNYLLQTVSHSLLMALLYIIKWWKSQTVSCSAND